MTRRNMEPDDVSLIARLLRGQNPVNSDCESATLYCVRYLTGNQCRSAMIEVAWSERLVLVTIRAAEFCTRSDLFRFADDVP